MPQTHCAHIGCLCGTVIMSSSQKEAFWYLWCIIIKVWQKDEGIVEAICSSIWAVCDPFGAVEC